MTLLPTDQIQLVQATRAISYADLLAQLKVDLAAADAAKTTSHEPPAGTPTPDEGKSGHSHARPHRG